MPYTFSFSEVNGGYSKYKVDAEPWRIIHPETALNQSKSSDGTITKIVFGLLNAEKTIDTRFDTVIINGTTYPPPSNADSIFDLLNAVFFNVNTGSGGTSGGTTQSGAYKEINSAYTTTNADRLINITGGTFDVTVVTPVGNQSLVQKFVNTGDGLASLKPTIGNIMGQNLQELPPGHSVMIESTGANFLIIAAY